MSATTSSGVGQWVWNKLGFLFHGTQSKVDVPSDESPSLLIGRASEVPPQGSGSTIDKTQQAAQRAFVQGPTQEAVFFSQDVAYGVSSVQQLSLLTEGGDSSKLPIGNTAYAATQVFTGVVNVARGQNMAEEGHKRGDTTAVVLGALNIPRGVSDITRGTTNTVVGITSQTGGVSPSVAASLGKVTSSLSMFSLTIIGARAIIDSISTFSMRAALKQAKTGGPDKAAQYLKDFTSIKSQDEQKAIQGLFAPRSQFVKIGGQIADKLFGKKESKMDNNFRNALQSPDRVEALKKWIDEIQIKDPNLPALTNMPAQIEQQLGDLSGITNEDDKMLIKQTAYKLYLADIENMRKTKEAVFNKCVGSEVHNLIIQGASAEDIVKLAEKELCKNACLSVLIVSASTIGVALTIAAQIMTGGAFLIVDLAINLALSLMWMGVDGYYLYKAYAATHALAKDKIAMALITLVIVIGSSVASALANSTTGLALTISAFGLWLIVGAYTLYQWKQESAPAGSAANTSAPDAGYGSAESALAT